MRKGCRRRWLVNLRYRGRLPRVCPRLSRGAERFSLSAAGCDHFNRGGRGGIDLPLRSAERVLNPGLPAGFEARIGLIYYLDTFLLTQLIRSKTLRSPRSSHCLRSQSESTNCRARRSPI